MMDGVKYFFAKVDIMLTKACYKPIKKCRSIYLLSIIPYD